MNSIHPVNPNDPAFALDVLIGRIVDGEASMEQHRQFEQLALTEADLWRRLALRQQDMAMLGAHVEPVMNKAEAVELPETSLTSMAISASDGAVVARIGARAPWWMAASGWAAVIALAALWGSNLITGHTNMQHGSQGLRTDARLVNDAPEEYLQHYMQAPYVMGDMPPTLLQIDPLSDGRFAVSYLRRIVEVKYYDRADQIPVDAHGNLTDNPRKVRPPATNTHAPAPSRD